MDRGALSAPAAFVNLCCLTLARCSSEQPSHSDRAARRRLSIAMAPRAPVGSEQDDVMRKTLGQFAVETGIPVTYVPALRWKPRRLNQYLEWLNARADTPDVYDADITDVRSLADHMIDLTPYVGDAPKLHFPSVMAPTS